MKKILAAVSILMALAIIGLTQENPKSLAPKADPVPANTIKLSAEDQKQLDVINERLAAMKPQLEDAKKQQMDAQAKLSEANSFIAQYNQVDAFKTAFFFRIAADVCGCKSETLEFAPDGKSIVHKTPAQAKAKP